MFHNLLGSVHILRKQISGKGGSQILMFVDMGEGGVDQKITDYVDMARGLRKLDFFCFEGRALPKMISSVFEVQ